MSAAVLIFHDFGQLELSTHRNSGKAISVTVILKDLECSARNHDSLRRRDVHNTISGVRDSCRDALKTQVDFIGFHKLGAGVGTVLV